MLLTFVIVTHSGRVKLLIVRRKKKLFSAVTKRFFENWMNYL